MHSFNERLFGIYKQRAQHEYYVFLGKVSSRWISFHYHRVTLKERNVVTLENCQFPLLNILMFVIRIWCYIRTGAVPS